MHMFGQGNNQSRRYAAIWRFLDLKECYEAVANVTHYCSQIGGGKPYFMKRPHRRTSIVLDQTNCEAKARPKSNIQNFPKGPETQNKAFARECYTNSQGHPELQALTPQNISISRVSKNGGFAREGYHK